MPLTQSYTAPDRHDPGEQSAVLCVTSPILTGRDLCVQGCLLDLACSGVWFGLHHVLKNREVSCKNPKLVCFLKNLGSLATRGLMAMTEG